MITCDFSTNEGYDFDVNIEVNDPDERYSAKELKKLLMESFDKIIDETQVLMIGMETFIDIVDMRAYFIRLIWIPSII